MSVKSLHSAQQFLVISAVYQNLKTEEIICLIKITNSFTKKKTKYLEDVTTKIINFIFNKIKCKRKQNEI